MAEFTNVELRKARDSQGLPRWKVAMEVGVSEDTIERWERGEVTPTPDDVDRLETLYKVPGMWHAWMRSHYDSYRARYPETLDMTTALSVVNVRHQMADLLVLQDAAERDAMTGSIDNETLLAKYRKEATELLAAITDALTKIGGDK